MWESQKKIYLGNSTTKDTHGKSSLKKSGRKSTTRTVQCTLQKMLVGDSTIYCTIHLKTRGIVHVEK